MGNTYHCCKCAGQREFQFGQCQSCKHAQCTTCRSTVAAPVAAATANTHNCCKCSGQKEFFYGRCKDCNHQMCGGC
ncbi:hypothetical protein PG995_008503 [Apiospora arundinis]|uniref:Metallothionein n=1 Tax=Apiospora arundinis TaxID=335852 RepID=A0ABR2JNH4_9PEZI